MRPLTTLAARLALGALGAPALLAQGSEVLLATAPETAPHAAEVWFASEAGLVVRGWPAGPRGTVDLPRGSDPRFDPGTGHLYFDRTRDDGHEEVARATWVLELGRVTPRPVRADENAPAFVSRVTTPESVAVRICIDPGHGGSDPGAIGIGGLRESDVNLDICLRLQALIQLDNQTPTRGGEWNLLMTRTGDNTLSLSQRTNAANAFGAASFLSVHNNAFSSSSANGTETFCYTGQSGNAGGALRNRVQAESLSAWQLRDRGVKEANFFVLRNTSMPAALAEGGFLTSPIDIVPLRDGNARQRFALGLLFAIQEHHGFQRWDPGSGGPSTGILRGIAYDVTQGTGARVPGALVALADGSFTVADSQGLWEFTLPPGPTAYAATAPGFDATELVRSVVAGGTIWGSIALTPANVPELRFSTATPLAGSSFSLFASGDAGGPALTIWSVQAGLPLTDLNAAYGLGVLWPDLTGALTTNLGTIPPSGTLSAAIVAPTVPGLTLHAQALTVSGGQLRLSNGAAVVLQ